MKRLAILLICILTFVCGCKASQQIDAPSSHTEFSSHNSAYDDIIEDYRNIVTFRISEDFESRWNNGEFIELSDDLDSVINSLNDTLNYRWECMLIEMLAYDSEENRFGYIMTDINDDDMPELFWIRGDHTVLAVFTVQDGKIVLLDAFRTRYSCVITDDFMVYTQSSGGASIIDYEIRYLSDDAKLVKSAGFSMYNDEYSEYASGETVSIDRSRFDELLIEYPFENSRRWIDMEIMPLGIENTQKASFKDPL